MPNKHILSTSINTFFELDCPLKNCVDHSKLTISLFVNKTNLNPTNFNMLLGEQSTCEAFKSISASATHSKYKGCQSTKNINKQDCCGSYWGSNLKIIEH